MRVLTGVLAFTIIVMGDAAGIDAQVLDGGSRVRNRAALVENNTGVSGRLTEAGLSIDLVFTNEVMSSLSERERGGTALLGNLDLSFSVDGERAFGWKGANFFAYFLGNYGDSPSEIIGDLQVVSNIDAFNTFKLYELWFEQRLLSDRLSVKVGLIDLNTEFDVIETGGLFLNSSFGIGPDYSQSGENGPSIFPTTSLGVRVNGWITPSVYLRAIVLDGVPGDPNDPSGTQVRFDARDGLLVGGEVGWTGLDEDSNAYQKLAIGSWHYTEPSIEDASGAGITRMKNRGFYILAERDIYREKDPEQGIIAFGRYGFANATINPIARFVGLGLSYTGAIPGRDADQLGIAMGSARGGDIFRQSLRTDGALIAPAETVVELAYQAEVRSWLVVRPDLQYVIDPGLISSKGNAFVIGLRVEISPRGP